MVFVTIGIFSFNKQGLDGAVFQMISHGLISGALFLSIGILYERTHTRDINMFGDYASKMPKFDNRLRSAASWLFDKKSIFDLFSIQKSNKS